MAEITAGMVEELRVQAGVADIAAHVGRAIRSDQIVNVNSAEIWLNIDPSADYDATFVAVGIVVGGDDQVVARVQTYSDQRVTEILDRRGDVLVVRVYGENPQMRQTMAEEVQAAMLGVDGIDDAHITVATEEPTIEIEVDLERAQTFGVKPGDVRRQAATLVSGLVVGNLFEDQKVFDVVVWGVPEVRATVDDINAMPIATLSGDHVPLGDLAEVRIVPNPTVIRHESVATYVDVTAPVESRSVGAVAADVDVALAGIQFPLEHHAEVLGDFEDERAAQSRVLAAAVAALILIYLLLQSAFSSWRLATLGFLALPMGISGALIAVAVTGGEMTLGSVAGIVAIFGLATRGVVLLVRSYQRRQRLGEEFGEDLIVSETAALVVPTTISILAIAVVFLPMVFAGSRPGLELAGPMAIAVLGGLVTTLLLTAVVVPAFYLRWGSVAHPDTTADDLVAPEAPPATNVGLDA
jgi:Cu/Ag efflux pump CusA